MPPIARARVAEHVDQPAAVDPQGITGIQVQHPILAQQLPIGARQHLAFDPRTLEGAAEDLHPAPLADRPVAHGHHLSHFDTQRAKEL